MSPDELLAFRPCGPCAAYVPYPSGCAHWRPQKSAKALSERTPEQRERARIMRQQQRAKARAAIADFERIMT